MKKKKIGIAKTKFCKNETTLKENLDKIVNLVKLDKNDVDVVIKNGKLEWLNVYSNGNNYGLQNGVMVLDAKNPFAPNLIEMLLKQYNPKNKVGLLKTGETRYYYKGTNDEVPNNFLWYGGHLWRVLEFDTKTKTLKLITQQPLTAINLAKTVWTNEESYESTYINKWLNTYFYNSLYKNIETKEKSDIQNHIVDTTFNIGITPYIGELTVSKKVGLLDEIQYTNAGGANSYLDIKEDLWLQNKGSSDFGKFVSSDGKLYNDFSFYAYGIRPVITISDIFIHEGNGTLEYNYKDFKKANSTSLVQVGDYIKLPYYGKDNPCIIDENGNKSCTFRVVSKDNDSIKVVLNGLLTHKSAYGDNAKIDTKSTIYKPLNNFANGINDEYQYTKSKKFNIGIYDKGKNYELLSEETIEANVGLPVVGEMFSGKDIYMIGSKTSMDLFEILNPPSIVSYWTMNRYTMSRVEVVCFGTLCNHAPSSTNYVRPVIFLKNDLKFTSGDGSPSAPYELEESKPR